MNDASMTRPRLSRAETKENTHRLLLEAAERVFVRLGYQGATLDGIAAEAGFTKGAVYWHFRNKEALFLKLLADGMERNSAAAEQIVTELAQRPDRLEEALGEWFDEFDASNNVPLLALELDLESRRNPSFAELLDEVVGKQHAVVRQILTRYFELLGREPSLPVDELAKTMIAVSRGIALARQTKHSAELTSAKVVRLLLGMPVGG